MLMENTLSRQSIIKLRPSEILEYLKCPKSYYLKYQVGAAPITASASLVFGSALHKVIEAYLKEEITTKSQMKDLFTDIWETDLQELEIIEQKTWPLNDLYKLGVKLLEQFPNAWANTKLVPLIDDEGFLIERKFEAQVADNIYITGTPDVVALNEQGEVVVLDFKTASSPATEGFAKMSDQLKAYTLLVSSYAQRMGFEGVSKVGFMEFLKRKRDPQILPPVMVETSPDEDFFQKIKWVARNIQEGYFFANPLMAWNSPCRMCDFINYCTNGSTEGLYMPNNFI